MLSYLCTKVLQNLGNRKRSPPFLTTTSVSGHNCYRLMFGSEFGASSRRLSMPRSRAAMIYTERFA